MALLLNEQVCIYPHLLIPEYAIRFGEVELPLLLYTLPTRGDTEDYKISTPINRNFIGIGIIWITGTGVMELFMKKPEIGAKIMSAFRLKEEPISIAIDAVKIHGAENVDFVVIDIIGSKDVVNAGIINDIRNILAESLNIKGIQESFNLGKDNVIRIRIYVVANSKFGKFISGEIQRMCTGMGLYCVGIGKADILHTPPEEVTKELIKYLGWEEDVYEEITRIPVGRRASMVKIQYGFANLRKLSTDNIKQILQFIRWLNRYIKGVTRRGTRVRIFYVEGEAEEVMITTSELFPFLATCAWMGRLLALSLINELSPSLAARLLALIEEFDALLAEAMFGDTVTSIVIGVTLALLESAIAFAVATLLIALLEYIKEQLANKTGGGG